jgi:hypothetical protein
MRVRKMARKTAWLGVLAAGVLGSGTALAVSDGGYNNSEQGCSGGAFNSDAPDRAEQGCRSLVFKIVDGTGHVYFSVGIPETPDGTSANKLVACLDPGAGTKSCVHISKAGPAPFPAQPGTKANPATGLHVYFGANDNLDGGEHDSSYQVDNGPSDGGAIQANVSPAAFTKWVSQALSLNKSYLLTHPLPGADTGFGACADGLCFSAQTQRRVAYQGSGSGQRDVANYDGKQWDPESCSGATGDDGPASCDGHDLSYWDEQNGTTYVEPGIQIYEDPDPQGSPILMYPIPALYIGTCGLVVGGGNVKAPASPFTNSAGQLVVKTGC